MIPLIIGGGLIGLPLGMLLALPFPEGSPLKAVFGLGGIAAPSVALLARSSMKWSEYLSECLAEYDKAKATLLDKPENKALKQAALAKGRIYYGSMRENGSPTVYDETAIMNDINAIT